MSVREPEGSRSVVRLPRFSIAVFVLPTSPASRRVAAAVPAAMPASSAVSMAVWRAVGARMPSFLPPAPSPFVASGIASDSPRLVAASTARAPIWIAFGSLVAPPIAPAGSDTTLLGS